MTNGVRRSPAAGVKADPDATAMEDLTAEDTPPLSADLRLAELTARCEHLEAAKEAAEVIAGATTSLLEMVYRELRGPLGDIASLIEYVRKTQLDPDQKRMVLVARSSITAVVGMLDTLLELPAIGDGQVRLEPRPFELRKLLKHVVSILTPIATKKGVQLVCDIDPKVQGRVVSDPTRLRQLLLFVARLGVKLAVKGEVTLLVAPYGEAGSTAVRFAIQNDGAGLPPEHLDQILRRTPMCPSSPDRIKDEVQAGLDLYGQLAELLGGTLTVDPLGRHGFVLWFTVAFEEPAVEPRGERRGADRREQELLSCSLGEVLDLSIGGMRVVGSRRPRGQVELQIFDWQTTIRFQAEVVWTKRLAFRRHEIGLRFVNLTPEQAKDLSRIWLNHSLRRVVGDA